MSVCEARLDPELSARIVAARPLAGVRAGSGLAWVGPRLIVVQDDVPAIALLDPADGTVVHTVLHDGGTPLAKADKPDYEAVVVGHDGTVYVLGSGSAPPRRRIARIDIGNARITLFDAGALYDAMGSELGATPNIEGALLVGDVLRLLHRGAGGQPSATIELARQALEGKQASVLSTRRFELGSLGGVPLAFTDAAQSAFGMLYVAVAEGTKTAIDDGPVAGAVVGVVDARGARFAVLVETDGRPSMRKAEGIALCPGERSGFLVTDPDDPARPAELLQFELRGPW